MGGEHVVESEKKEGPNVVAAPGVASPFQGAAADPWLPLDVSIGSHRLSIASSKPSGVPFFDSKQHSMRLPRGSHAGLANARNVHMVSRLWVAVICPGEQGKNANSVYKRP